MPYEINTAVGHYDFLSKIKSAATGLPLIGLVEYSGSGDGILSAINPDSSAVTEEWTITCTATSLDGGIFSVSGSVSGAQADATVGVAYSNSLIDFVINDGVTDFAISDEFTINVSVLLIADRWVILRDDTTGDDHELILKGVGLSGVDEIYIGFKTIQDVTGDYYNLIVGTMTGYVSGNTFEMQPGVKLSTCPMWQFSIPYWLMINAQRIMFGVNIEANYDVSYVGKMLPYMSPGQFPYPVLVMGSVDGASVLRYSDTSRKVGCFEFNDRFQVRFIDGVWTNVKIWPFSSSSGDYDLTSQFLIPTGGVYPLTPLVLYNSGLGVYGEMDGVYFVTGHAMSVEDTISNIDKKCIVMRNINRTGFFDYIALELN